MILIYILLLVITLYNFIMLVKHIKDYRQSKSSLNRYSEFNKKIIDWAREITDTDVRYEYMSQLISFDNKLFVLTNDKKVTYDKSILDKRTFIIENYSKYIPSLLKELREEKLNKILK